MPSTRQGKDMQALCLTVGRFRAYRARDASLEYLTLEMLAYGRQKPAFSHFVARIFKKVLAEQLTHFIRKLL